MWVYSLNAMGTFHMLLSPCCGEPLAPSQESLTCRACGESYAAPFGVPIIVSGAVIERVAPPSEQFVADISAALGANADKIRECFSLRVKMPDPGMQTEAEQFANRVRSSGHSIVSGQETKQISLGPVNVPDQIKVQLTPLMWPTVFQAGCHHSVNVRVSNVGQCAISSKATPPFAISYHWHGTDGQITEGARTALLIDLAPGRSITLPVTVVAPREVGSYRLDVTPVLETVCWFKEFTATTGVRVDSYVAPLMWEHDVDGPIRSYADDHGRGVEFLTDWIDRHVPAREPRILEIGGNFNPMTASLPRGERWNLDVDAHGLMARNIVGSDQIKSVVADGSDLPFADGYLDVIVMFATFHHFPEPVGLLRHLAKKVNRDGLVCLMCEPIGHVTVNHDYPDYIHELEMGVNEQSFEVWEYIAMLEAAGMQIVDAKFDRGSAKIAARPIAASGM